MPATPPPDAEPVYRSTVLVRNSVLTRLLDALAVDPALTVDAILCEYLDRVERGRRATEAATRGKGR